MFHDKVLVVLNSRFPCFVSGAKFAFVRLARPSQKQPIEKRLGYISQWRATASGSSVQSDTDTQQIKIKHCIKYGNRKGII